MSYVFNMVGGSSGGSGPTSADAILTVKVFAGSTVAMTKGGVTLTPTMWTSASDSSSECAVFVISSSLFDAQNSWTVTAINSIDTFSENIFITTNAIYELDLNKYRYLYRAGNEFIDLTGGWIIKYESSNRSAKYSDYLYTNAYDYNGQEIVTSNKIDLTNYRTIKYHVIAATSSNSNSATTLSAQSAQTPLSSPSPVAQTTGIKNVSNPTTYSVDISNVTGSYYVAFLSFNRSTCSIDAIYLEK